MTPIFACVMCSDAVMFEVIPFAFYWQFVFVIWAFWLGVPLAIAAKVRKETLPLYPHHYLALAVVLEFVSAVLEWSVALPLTIVTGVAVARTIVVLRQSKSLPEPPKGATRFAYRVQRVFLAVCLGLVPVAYVRLLLQIL